MVGGWQPIWWGEAPERTKRVNSETRFAVALPFETPSRAPSRSWTCQTDVQARSWVRLGARFDLADENAAIGLIALISGSGLSGASPHQINRQPPPLPGRLEDRF